MHRRQFLGASATAAAALVSDLDFLRPWARASADTTLGQRGLHVGSELDSLVALVRSTPREKIVPVFARQLTKGLSYRNLLTTLFLAATETDDLHQIAQVFGAHRIGQNARLEERLLPLFWALDRLKTHDHTAAGVRSKLPIAAKASEADALFLKAMREHDKIQAQQSILALARDHGGRYAMGRLWEFACRNLGGTLGHTVIGVANAWRSLEAIGWEHASPALTYLGGEIARFRGDNTFAPNMSRVQKTLPQLAADWTSKESSRDVVVELYRRIRSGEVDASCDFICSSLADKSAKSGAIWDAISLTAADLLYRYSVGGNDIGGVLIHAVTTTNALRFGFELVDEPRTKLLYMLQAAGVVDWFVQQAKKDGRLRKMNLLDGLKSDAAVVSAEEIFARLPRKDDYYEQKAAEERLASDEACQIAFSFVSVAKNQESFLRTARSFLCRKASPDPHDIKFPAAVFEDALRVSPEWRPYLLASSVHALHGAKSADAKVLVQARDALR